MCITKGLFVAGVPQGPPDDMLVTTCPQCQHCFPCEQQESAPLVVSATLTLPSVAAAACTVRVQVGQSRDSLILQRGLTGGLLTIRCPSTSPEPSPSDPIAFIIPSPRGWTFPTPPANDLERLSATMRALRTSGWYHEGLSWQESADLLVPTAPGTFLARNSSDPRFLFSLSVQTQRGPTSVRLHYHDGNFRLDAASKLVPTMPVFPCVVRLVEYYVASTNDKSRDRGGREQVWIDCSGQTYSSILLTRPLLLKGRFPSLQHLARLALHRHGQGKVVPLTDLPQTLHSYLAEYPYSQ